MEREDRVCDTTAQAYIKLETALSLYRALENNASEQEKLLLLAALRDVKIILCDGEEYITSLQQGIVETVDNFGSHLGLIAINRLVHDVELIKRELENFDNEKEFGKKEERKPKQLTDDDVELSDEDNQCFERITKRRHELLSEVEAFLPVEKDTKRAGFLPSRTILRNPVPSSDTTEDVPDRNQTNNDTIKQLKNALRDKQARLKTRRTRLVPRKVSGARCTLHNAGNNIERSKITRNSRANKKAIKVDPNSFDLCVECKAILKEKDLFWGLEDKSESDVDVEEQILKRHILISTITQKDGQTPLPIIIKDTKSDKIYMIHHKPAGHAGRGTWATPPYRPITVTRLDKCEKIPKRRQVEPVKKSARMSRMRYWISNIDEQKLTQK